MGYITIFTVFLIAALLAVKWKEDLYDTFPMTVSALILFLYVMAFIKGLVYVDFVAAGLCLGIFISSLWIKGTDAKAGLKKAMELLVSWKSLLLLAVCIAITCLVKDKAALWWDDINYWAVDAKALYYNGGFAGKYGNVAPEFGDYPPAIQLFKWFFLHLSPDVFREGLMFGAYHCLNLIYMLPLLRKIPKNKPWLVLLGMLGIFLVPGIVDGVAKEGTCADVTMGIVYGAFLWAVLDDKNHKPSVYYGRLMLYLSVLVLTKSVGIEWAFFGMVFFFLFHFYRAKENGIAMKTVWKHTMRLVVVCLLTEGSWLGFCLLNRRVAKLTGAGVRIAVSGDFSFLKNALDKMKYYAEGFIMYPMHGEQTWGLDLSTAALLILFFVMIFVYRHFALLQKWEAKRMVFFVLFTAFMAYGIIFLGHITIFAQEAQYEDAYVMAKSISRYGAPFTLGLLYMFMGIFIEKKGESGWWICLAGILLTTSLPGAYQTLYGYRDTLQQDLVQRDAMVEEEARIFKDKIEQELETASRPDLFETRTLYLRDNNTIHWVKDTYISFEVAPVPVVYGGIASDMEQEALLQSIRSSHADYLYADKVEGDTSHLFESMVETPFEYETFYEIKEENGRIVLIPLQ